MRIISKSEFIEDKKKTKALNKWNIASIKVGEGVEFEDGHNGRTLLQIRKYAFNVASREGIKITTQLVDTYGVKKLQILRVL